MVPVPHFQQDRLPLRVIDVDATLSSEGSFRFCEVDNMQDFCVISHRWNDHVTSLMEEMKGTAKEFNCSYPQAVTKKNWAHVPATKEAYLSIKAFLEVLLEVHGVKKVWIDTLCIDQTDKSKEKSREVRLMGAYYRHSSACYVPINGLGLNYKLRMGEHVTQTLPWLNRVWTLQEFLLPDRIFFLVELEEWMEKWLALRVATAGKDLAHFCTCCVSEFSFMLEALKRMSEEMKGVPCKVEKIREADMNHRCTQCGCPPLLTKAFKNKPDCKLYLVQREMLFAVVCLAQFEDRVKRNDWKESREQQLKRFDEVWPFIKRNEWLLRVMHVRRQGIWFNTFEMVEEVRSRQTSLECDRVWGILGLLGVDADRNSQQEQHEDPQLAAKSSADLVMTPEPEKQLIELACKGELPEQLLVEFCWMDTHSGRFIPQASWIPDLTGEVSSLGVSVSLYNHKIKQFHSLASNVRVAPEGPITLSVKVLKGYVTCEDEKNLSWTSKHHHLHFKHSSLVHVKYEDDLFSYSRQFEHGEVQRFNQEHRDIIDPDDRAFGGRDGTLELSFDEHGSFKIPLKNRSFYGFEMWLLYLGHFRGTGCVLLGLHKRGDGNTVHKIGTLHATYMGMKTPLDNLEDAPQDVTISGYGKYLDNHVDREQLESV